MMAAKDENLRRVRQRQVKAASHPVAGINAAPEPPTTTAEIVVKGAMKHFKRLPHTIYRLMIVPNPYDHSYNFFFEYARPHHRTRSIPLHTIYNDDLANLEEVVRAIRQINGLPIHFRNFKPGSRWPKSGHRIHSL